MRKRGLRQGCKLPVTVFMQSSWRVSRAARGAVAAAGGRGTEERHTFSQPDMIIAATALHHGLTIVSRDTSEYEAANVPVLNPWTTKV